MPSTPSPSPFRWRPHPADSPDEVAKARRLHPAMELSVGVVLERDLEWADAVITVHSSAMFEALFADVPVFFGRRSLTYRGNDCDRLASTPHAFSTGRAMGVAALEGLPRAARASRTRTNSSRSSEPCVGSSVRRASRTPSERRSTRSRLERRRSERLDRDSLEGLPPRVGEARVGPCVPAFALGALPFSEIGRRE